MTSNGKFNFVWFLFFDKKWKKQKEYGSDDVFLCFVLIAVFEKRKLISIDFDREHKWQKMDEKIEIVRLVFGSHFEFEMVVLEEEKQEKTNK